MSFNIENESVVCQLYHRTKHNNSVNVVCELSEKIGSPQLENGEWVVPNDVTGLNAKKSKVVKIRFHPSVSKLSSEGSALHQAACESALKYLDLLLDDSDWTRKTNHDDDLFGKQIDKIIEYLSEMDKIIEIDTSKIGLTLLHDEFFDEFVKLISCKSISSHLHTIISDDDDAHQSAQIVFEKDGRSRQIISIDVDAGYLKSSESGQECVFDVSKTCFTWVLPRHEDDFENSPPTVSHKLDCYMWIDEEKQEMPVYSPCASVFHHLDKLTASLSACGSPTFNGVLQRVPQVLAVDAIIGLDKSEAPHLHKFIQNITQAPLMVHTDFDNESLDCYSDSECKLTISPTDSIDSGVSLTSPTRQGSFDEDDGDDELTATSPGMRTRSRSESCSSLKGILKWPRRPNTMSRLAAKPYLIRSYSECHHDESSFPPLIPLRFSEDDEDAFHETDDSSSDCCVLPAAPRKKSVSFSERIEQTRLFNSNTSINAQKRKNLKKNEKKKKRENSLASSIESIHEETGRISPAARHQTV
ncbi:SH2 domain-containing protein [Caenorhabditis elegans]|uniref:SH2 domain-containing protein n=1 Tax=Caenorhabditis elegans TaxID=6239 RepID=Q93762_CAEEL|nr:SH2 domain-containing protein [Caenorhabditis elegans]CAB02121.1 SH2 domain-containing protein [Caenorhabditis elegans]|eukprot:NP_001256545.1 Uncharacterized protein CELE_F53C11.4 [Caenorhabditis elegans]